MTFESVCVRAQMGNVLILSMQFFLVHTISCLLITNTFFIQDTFIKYVLNQITPHYYLKVGIHAFTECQCLHFCSNILLGGPLSLNIVAIARGVVARDGLAEILKKYIKLTVTVCLNKVDKSEVTKIVGS